MFLKFSFDRVFVNYGIKKYHSVMEGDLIHCEGKSKLLK